MDELRGKGWDLGAAKWTIVYSDPKTELGYTTVSYSKSQTGGHHLIFLEYFLRNTVVVLQGKLLPRTSMSHIRARDCVPATFLGVLHGVRGSYFNLHWMVAATLGREPADRKSLSLSHLSNKNKHLKNV